jgi:Asp-tRNA(Asn)/Glu-tRNA(Gln) amidotransferase A subunit family amidase
MPADLLARCLADLPAAARALAEGAVTSARLVDAALERHAAWEPKIHAFAWLDPARAKALAARADRARLERGPFGPLHGVPVALKDIFDTAGIPTENGTPLHKGRVPQRSADVVLALERAGAVILGKTVTTELAFYHPGPTRNPWDPARTPGGSSQGSAAAVAAGIVPGAVGSQTNGSVIRPAAFCGVVGFKPSHGRLPVTGVLPFAPTLDTVGAFARSVEGAAWLAAVMAGDPPDAWAPLAGPAIAELPPPRLAVAPTVDAERADPAMRARFDADVEALAAAGARVERPPLPGGIEDAIPVHRTIMACEANESFGALVSGRESLVSAQLRGLVEEGAKTPRVVYETALRDRERLIDEFEGWAEPFDALLTLPAAGEAPTPETTGDPRFCTRWTLLGVPAVTIPTGLGPSGLPLGLQIVGAPGDDRRLLQTAWWVERRRPAPQGP